MIIIGIDPGFLITGYSIMKKEGGKLYLLDYGILKMSSQKTISERIGNFYDFLVNKIEAYQIDSISIETPFLGKNALNFLKLGYLRGVIYLISDKFKIVVYEFAPSEVKLSLTGFGGASKDQVARVVLKLFPGMNMPQKLDITDALAITLCGIWKNKSLLSLHYQKKIL